MSLRGRLIRWFYFAVVRLFFTFSTRLKIEGKENIPAADDGPVIVVSNHFSLFEVPLLAILLPRMPTYFGASELINMPVIRFAMPGFKDDIIFVNRGRMDRRALKKALEILAEGRWLSIFPEGGITPTTIAMAAGGETTDELVGHNSRISGDLLPAQPGAALLAIQSQARILPIAFMGTEHIEDDLKRWRRTPVTVRIGRPYGPLEIDSDARGRARREKIDAYGHQMMEAVAHLFPATNRGAYGYIDAESAE